MNYVVVAGYVCSGSSVVCDLLKEVNEYYVPDVEFKVLREPHGLIDLEKKLLEDWNFFSSAIAIKEFEDLISSFTINKSAVYQYERIFNQNFGAISRNFIDSITSFSYEAGSSMFPNLLKEDTKQHLFKKKNYNVKQLKFSHVDKQKFFSAVHCYLDNIFAEYGNKGFTSIVLDQGLHPNSTTRINDYFPNGKMIIVDRDPRDVAVSMMRRNKGIGPELSLEMNAQKYSEWFLATRQTEKKYNENVLYIRYEELINDYKNSTRKVFDFLNIDSINHINQFKHFDPNISKTRIGQWKNYNDTSNKIFFEQIEKNLAKYLY